MTIPAGPYYQYRSERMGNTKRIRAPLRTEEMKKLYPDLFWTLMNADVWCLMAVYDAERDQYKLYYPIYHKDLKDNDLSVEDMMRVKEMQFLAGIDKEPKMYWEI